MLDHEIDEYLSAVHAKEGLVTYRLLSRVAMLNVEIARIKLLAFWKSKRSTTEEVQADFVVHGIDVQAEHESRRTAKETRARHTARRIHDQADEQIIRKRFNNLVNEADMSSISDASIYAIAHPSLDTYDRQKLIKVCNIICSQIERSRREDPLTRHLRYGGIPNPHIVRRDSLNASKDLPRVPARPVPNMASLSAPPQRVIASGTPTRAFRTDPLPPVSKRSSNLKQAPINRFFSKQPKVEDEEKGQKPEGAADEALHSVFKRLDDSSDEDDKHYKQQGFGQSGNIAQLTETKALADHTHNLGSEKLHDLPAQVQATALIDPIPTFTNSIHHTSSPITHLNIGFQDLEVSNSDNNEEPRSLFDSSVGDLDGNLHANEATPVHHKPPDQPLALHSNVSLVSSRADMSTRSNRFLAKLNELNGVDGGAQASPPALRPDGTSNSEKSKEAVLDEIMSYQNEIVEAQAKYLKLTREKVDAVEFTEAVEVSAEQVTRWIRKATDGFDLLDPKKRSHLCSRCSSTMS